jgi:HD-like signal output (HDOD) protein
MSEVSELLQGLNNKIKNDKLVLPTLPKVAMKVREACDDMDTTVNTMVDILSQDPALSARMIKYANSAIVKRQSKKNIDNLNQVVTRIGLIQIKNIATAMAMEQLFISTHRLISDYIKKSWTKTTKVSCYATALLKIYLEDNPRSKLNIDTMTLIGLVYNIGMLPILTEAEAKEGKLLEEASLNYCIDKFSNEIGVKIIDSWGFSFEFNEVVKNWNNLDYKTEAVSYLDFIRMAILLNEYYPKSVNKEKLSTELHDKGVIEEGLVATKLFQDTLRDVSAIFS